MINAYLIIDIGTGNVRVAVCDVNNNVLGVERSDVQYVKDELYPDALYFNPDELWKQIIVLTKEVLQKNPDVNIKAITASSQREGIVLIDKNGHSLIGLSNHDHRGREWEHTIENPHRIYTLAGRYPTSLFSAMKLVGIKHRRPEVFEQLSFILSISDWTQYQLCGVAGYEHSQASETLLYDVEKKQWSDELCDSFQLSKTILPPLHDSGTVQGNLLQQWAETFHITPNTVVIAGGADTQLAIKSTQPSVEDIVIVSGTTTPVVKIIDEYLIDEKERTWTNRHIAKEQFILEANAGVTGLNLQRLKEIFYPNESYEVMEAELASAIANSCFASLGSTIASEKTPISKAGFVFDVPVSHQLTRACFIKAAVWDIACAVKENLDCLSELAEHQLDYVWACGGGFQSASLRQAIADLTGKNIYVRKGYRQASVVGGAIVCGEVLGNSVIIDDVTIEITSPQQKTDILQQYKDWKKVRESFQPKQMEEAVV